MKKIIPGIAGVAFVVTLGIGLNPVIAQAAKVDCTKVMSELNHGKKAFDVSQDLGISTSSVYRCRRKAGAVAGKSRSTAAAEASHMAMPGPAQGTPSSH